MVTLQRNYTYSLASCDKVDTYTEDEATILHRVETTIPWQTMEEEKKQKNKSIERECEIPKLW